MKKSVNTTSKTNSRAQNIFLGFIFFVMGLAAPLAATASPLACHAPAALRSSAPLAAVYVEPSLLDAQQLYAAAASAAPDTFHLFSHGRPGMLLINGQWLDAPALAAWLRTSGLPQGLSQLNIYGCEFGQGEVGAQAVKTLEQALGLKVAASTNLTGQGGDWLLEAGVPTTLSGLKDYAHSLQCTGPGGDCDGDGVSDANDLDDDNDGILDTDEGFGEICTSTPPVQVGANVNWGGAPGLGTSQTTMPSGVTTYTAGTIGGTSSISAVSISAAGNSISGTMGWGFGPGNNPAFSMHNTPGDSALDDSSSVTISFGSPVQLQLFHAASDFNTSEVYTVTTAGAAMRFNNPNNQNFSIQNNNSTAIIFNPNTPQIYNVTPGTWTLDIPATSSITISRRDTAIPKNPDGSDDKPFSMTFGLKFFASTTTCSPTQRDTDQDNIPDHQDLNSDADLCGDATDGGGSFINNGRLTTTAVDGNGVPTVAGSGGQGVGDSRTATLFQISSNPSDVTVNAASASASFTVGITAKNTTTFSTSGPTYPALNNGLSESSFQWYLGDPASGGSALSNTAVYSNTQTRTLNISNVNNLIGNRYYVVATNTNSRCTVLKESALLSSSVVDLALTKTNNWNNSGTEDLPDDVLIPGVNTVYKIIVTNNGPQSVTGAKVTDTDSGLTCTVLTCSSTSGACPTATNLTVSNLQNTTTGVTLGTLPVNGTVTLSLTCDPD